MTKRRITATSSTLLNLGAGLIFGLVSLILVVLVNRTMRQQALAEAEAKARILLDRNLATHTYFSQVLKPSLFEWTEPFRTEEYFDPVWMSSTYAVREIDHFFQEFSQTSYYVKDAAINARSPENEADAYERAYLEDLRDNPNLLAQSIVREIEGEPYFVVLRPGEVLEESCLRCHSEPEAAPQGLVDYYGAERSFHREGDLDEVISVMSIRVPLAEAYGQANRFSLHLSGLLLVLLAGLFAAHLWLQRRLVFDPLRTIRDKAREISTKPEHLGEEIGMPLAQDLGSLVDAFNRMSRALRQNVDQLEERVAARTVDLATANQQLEREITERKQAEAALQEYSENLEETIEGRTQELRQAQEALIRQERLAVLGQLAGGVGHELRNPLGVMSNAVYFLQVAQPQADTKVQEYLGILEREIRTSERIINDLLNFARVKPADQQAVAVRELVRQVLARYPAPDGVTVSIRIDDEPRVYVDAQQMIQVLNNLVVNAYQAMPDGGSLDLSASQQGGEVAIAVRDTGQGIPAENVERVFEPLFTTKSKGIGMGLSVCKILVEANSGRIEVQSEPGKGSTFTVHLPSVEENE